MGLLHFAVCPGHQTEGFVTQNTAGNIHFIFLRIFFNFVLQIPRDSIGTGPYECCIHDGFVAILRDCGLRKPLDVTSVSLSKLCLVENNVTNDKQMSWRRLSLLLLFAWTDMLESLALPQHTQKYRDTWAIVSNKH